MSVSSVKAEYTLIKHYSEIYASKHNNLTYKKSKSKLISMIYKNYF